MSCLEKVVPPLQRRGLSRKRGRGCCYSGLQEGCCGGTRSLALQRGRGFCSRVAGGTVGYIQAKQGTEKQEGRKGRKRRQNPLQNIEKYFLFNKTRICDSSAIENLIEELLFAQSVRAAYTLSSSEPAAISRLINELNHKRERGSNLAKKREGGGKREKVEIRAVGVSNLAALSCHGVTPSERSIDGGCGARFGGPFRRDVTLAAWQANPRQDLDMARAGSDS
ncbi:hypothetical protein ALC60_09786 [Trachymyrmex zeteki]|uniref:Uncharacterized protein n=1 Tax=Mycetomoellerius zeteki TaxID=64791 RepID=A0A151WTH8_9HYME|nr:hypothetical protein ALC60_09786 [Trachymyrmex zeteki]